MENKQKNELIALSIVLLATVAGSLLVLWFYSVIAPISVKTDNTKTVLEIKDNILKKVTVEDNGSPLILQDGDFGRENPFGNIK